MAQTHTPQAHAEKPLILLIPGLDGSGPGHWQRRWSEEMDDAQMVDLGLWEKPHRNTWINRLNLAVQRAGRPVVLVAHSLGCLLTAWWAKFEQPGWSSPVVGALLVAPPEVDFFPRDDRLNGFAPTPADALPFPSILVASRNDPWIGFPTAQLLAKQWGSEFEDAGEAGHINADSKIGSWEDGKLLLHRLLNTRPAASVPHIPTHGDWSEGLEYRS
ncbi:RBBP9/YdeN family alpha/beta hydrolase [Novosphingobium clariflavum]|uniref:RBBP9/YdeN family alpha/beta hydrolase n=1 Tax=Novosphingobium clariflavum TaxID=2029884 RepID=A0ABV6S360_9SPHN|nr:alpha/beta hydrolase [Novosphingobium clariflavum]